MALCRMVNGVPPADYQVCKRCRNSYQRYRVGTGQYPPSRVCEYDYRMIMQAVAILEQHEIVFVRLQPHPDKDMTRGWDYMLVIRPVEEVPPP